MSRTAAERWTGVKYPCDTTEVDPADLTEATDMAQGWLFGLSGGRVGLFSTVGDEYRVSRGDACGVPYKGADGEWRNGGVDGHGCCRVELFRQPVYEVAEVRIEGVVLDPLGYVLLDNSVTRIGACWPADGDCDEPAISIDYRWGVRPGMVAKAACGELACEFLAALDPSAECRLPSSWTQVVRQGVTMSRPDTATLIGAGLTGLPLVDTFISAYNPSKLKQRSRVVHLDDARRAS